MFSKIYYYIKFIIYYIRVRLQNILIVNGYFDIKGGHITNNNYGDDINIPLLKALTGRKVEPMRYAKYIENLQCIGSVIGFLCNNDTIVWGSGLMMGDETSLTRPKQIYAVRGPETRRKLLKEGIECPELYGDPALLFPLIYKPQIEKKYTVGVIPHYKDLDLPQIESFIRNRPQYKLIKLRGYKTWEDVIDQICSCEIIISSSLHGLIISDAYNIPNVRVRFSDKILGGNFKFKDYYGGVGRKYVEPLDFTEEINLNKVYEALSLYNPIQYDYKPLLKAFPYKLSKQFQLLLGV